MQHHTALIAGVLYRDCNAARRRFPGCCHSTHALMNRSLLRLDLAQDRDIVAARQRARQVSALLGFDSQDQVRIATAVSELARNAIRHAGGGTIEFMLAEAPMRGSRLTQSTPANHHQRSRPRHCQPGRCDHRIAHRRAEIGPGCRASADGHVRCLFRQGRGTTITLGKFLPRRTEGFPAARAATIADQLSAYGAADPTAEIQQQNRELLRSLEELRLRKEDLARLNAELEDTNRGVMALYAELEERAAHLRLADETKSASCRRSAMSSARR